MDRCAALGSICWSRAKPIWDCSSSARSSPAKQHSTGRRAMIEPPKSGSANVDLAATVGNCELKMSVTVPAGPTRLDDLVPLLQILSDNVVAVAEHEAAQQGVCISCRKGCGACCRQLVPISPVEARHVARL